MSPDFIMTEEKVSVVEAIVKNKDGKILLLKRSKLNNHFVGKWQLPGGKVNFGEDPTKAIKREIIEETGRKPSDLRIIKVFSHKNLDFKDKLMSVMVFSCILNGDICISEDHSDFSFFEENKINENDLTDISKKAIFD